MKTFPDSRRLAEAFPRYRSGFRSRTRDENYIDRLIDKYNRHVPMALTPRECTAGCGQWPCRSYIDAQVGLQEAGWLPPSKYRPGTPFIDH